MMKTSSVAIYHMRQYQNILSFRILLTLIVLLVLLLPSVSRALDSDNDSVEDTQDNCTQIANPDQNDSNGDGYGNICDADLDNNGSVSFADLDLFRSAFGTNNPHADLDGNGSVSFADLDIFRSLFGKPPGPSAKDIELNLPAYNDPSNLPELMGDWYGAMGEHPVNKISINNPAYPNEIVNQGNNYPGDNSYYFGSEDGTVQLKVDLYTPADTTTTRPTIFFISGWRHYFSEQYYSLLYFIASQGFNAIFVSYDETNGASQNHIKNILETVVSDPKFSPLIDTTKVGFMGHSMGAGILFELATKLDNWGTQGRFLFPLAGATAYHQNQPLINLPPNTKMIVQTYNERQNDRHYDWDTDPRFSVDYLINSNVSDVDKTYLYLPGDADHPSNHSTPKSRYENGAYYFDALQQVGIFRPLESLMRSSFENDTQWNHIGLPASDPNLRTMNGIQFYSGDNPYIDLNIANDPSDDYRFRFNDAAINPDRLNAPLIHPLSEGRLLDNGLPSLLEGTNPTFATLAGYVNSDLHAYIANDSHTNDGSGSAELLAHHYGDALTSASFHVEKGKKYLLSGHVKMSHVPYGQNIVFGITPRSIAGRNEVYWNASKENMWEEVLLPFIPLTSGEVSWRVFTTTRAFSTTTSIDRVISGSDVYKPDPVRDDGSNLDDSSRVFLDDFKVVEIKEVITPREPIAEKIAFSSDYIRVDKLGNYSVNKEGVWVPIIPKLISRGVVEPIAYFRDQLNAYQTHGFNGVIGMYDKNQAIEAYAAGLEYIVGMGASSNTLPDGTQGEYSSVVTGEKNRFIETQAYIRDEGKPYSMLFHYLDNENVKLQEYAFKEVWANFIDKNDQDQNGNRGRPIFYLNGHFGMSRLYSRELMDITGSYVGMGGVGSPSKGAPKQTIGIMDVTQNDTAPATVIQLQVYLEDKFIPSLWFGIIQGGKIISVWSDGTGDGIKNDNPKPFQLYDWAQEIHQVFDQLDSIASLIREPHWTSWKAHVAGSEYINLGTRNYNGDAYLIISNHSDNDEMITITFESISPSSVTDHLGNTGDTAVLNGHVEVTVGHGNDGYLVLKLLQ
jgi:dienelactone hydrolase